MFYMIIPYLNLSNIYNSGQTIGWRKVSENKYIVTHKDKIVQVTQRKENFSFSCSEEEFYNTWYDYFDLGTDYSLYFNFFRTIDKEDLRPMCNRCKGLHILRQDIFRVIIYGIFYEKTKSFSESNILCDILSQLVGRKRKKTISGQVIDWFEFPSAESILKKSQRLDNGAILRFKNEILYVCELIVDGWLDLDYLQTLSQYCTREAREYLTGCEIPRENVKLVMVLALHKLSYFIDIKNVNEFIEYNFQMFTNDFIDWASKKSKNIRYCKRNISYLNFILVYNCLLPAE